MNWTPELRATLNFDQSIAINIDNGIFWIDWKSVLHHFNSVYMNWNPALFHFIRTVHDDWPLTAPGPKLDTYNLGYNPQYALVVDTRKSKKGTSAVWVQLSRHMRSGKLGIEKDINGFLTVHVYDKLDGSTKTFYPSDALIRSTYTNNPHTLVRFDVPGKM